MTLYVGVELLMVNDLFAMHSSVAVHSPVAVPANLPAKLIHVNVLYDRLKKNRRLWI